MRQTGRLMLFVVLLVTFVASCDALVFRSGFYQRTLMEPQSTAGSTLDAIAVVRRFYVPGKKNVLVLGNSQVGEGLSQGLASQASGAADLNFINAAVPGSGPRLWHYLLREVDPGADRFFAVVMSVPYDPGRLASSYADYAPDIAYVAPLLRLSDLLSFPATFDDPALVARARRAILFPAQPMREDIAALFAGPMARYDHVRSWWGAYVDSFAAYAGHAEALPDLPIDAATRAPSDWLGRESELRPLLSDYFQGIDLSSSPALRAANETFFRDFLGRLAAPYRANKIPVVVIAMPRGPWHGVLEHAPVPTGPVAALASAGLLLPLPGDTFTDLEQPRFFFDSKHMNAVGRTRFSQRLGELLSAVLH